MHPYFHLFGNEISAYAAMYVIGILAALSVSLLLSGKRKLPTPKTLLLFLSAVASGFVGAALTYVFVTYTPREVIDMLKSGTFRTGLVFYGGFVFGTAFTLLIAKLLKLCASEYIPVFIPALPAGHALGRVGCYLAGCCYGIDGYPVQLLEAVILTVISVILISKSAKGGVHILSRYILLYAPARFLLEFLRADDIRGSFLCFSTSQWISLALIAAVIVYRLIKKKEVPHNAV